MLEFKECEKKILFTSHGCYEHSWLYKVLWVVRLVLSVSDKTAVQKWLIQRIAVKERRSNAHFHFLIKQITFRFHWHARGHTSFAWHLFCCKCIRSLSNRQSLITKHQHDRTQYNFGFISGFELCWWPFSIVRNYHTDTDIESHWVCVKVI